jgi:hypothetical protein
MTAPKERSPKRSFFFPSFFVAQQWSVLKEKRACKLSFDLKLLAMAEKQASREKQTDRQTDREVRLTTFSTWCSRCKDVEGAPGVVVRVAAITPFFFSHYKMSALLSVARLGACCYYEKASPL